MTADAQKLSRRAILSDEERAMLETIQVSQASFHQAAQETGLHPDILRKLVRDAVLEGLDDPAKPEMGTCDIDQAKDIATHLIAARKPVDGNPINPTDASRKYGFSPTVLYKWQREGWINLVPGNRTLFNEGDLAFAKALSDLISYKSGKAIFPPKPRSGRPRKRKN
jgi:hypothetical protein